MTRILRFVHYGWLFFWIISINLLFVPVYYIFSRNPKFYGILNRLRTFSCRLISLLGGVFFTFEFEKDFDRTGTYIYCANHSSSLDILVMCVLGRGRYHFMGKEELTRNPFWRIFFTTIDIPVSRDSKISAFRAFKKAGENLDNNMSLIIFPEGKIGNDFPPKLHDFKNGPFRLAIEKNIPIVPITIVNLWQHVWDSGSKYGTKPGIIKIFVHKPISTMEMEVSNADNLKDIVYQKINSKLIYQ